MKRIVFALLINLLCGFVSLSAQITSPGTDYVSFWSGELRIFAQRPDTEVLLIDIDTAVPLSFADPRIDSSSHLSNPFVLTQEGDMFLGEGGLGGPNDEIRVRIITSDGSGGSEEKPITVWTGSTPTFGPTKPQFPTDENPWGSFLPANLLSSDTFGREVGRNFLGFTQSELIVTVPTVEGQQTQLTLENLDLATSTSLTLDAGVPVCPALPIPAGSPPCYLLDDPEVQVVFHNDYQNHRIRVTSSQPSTVLTGHALLTEVADDFTVDFGRTDWSSTPPSFAAGDEGLELGTLFYTVVRSALTIYPTQDDTTVQIIDLSDGDDTITVNLPHGSPSNPQYSFYTPYDERLVNAGLPTPIQTRLSGPEVGLIENDSNPFDNDVVKVVSDKPVLLYLGPVGSDFREMGDVAFSVPLGFEQRVVYAYAQNFGESNDLQLFVFQRDTQVSITSLSTSTKTNTHHDFAVDFDVPPGTPPVVAETPAGSQFVAGPTSGDNEHFGSGVWHGEILRIESTRPVTVINGDYDTPNFGAYIPFIPPDRVLPPVAVLTADQPRACQGDLVLFDGADSFDQDSEGPPPQIVRYDWDFADGTQLPDAGPEQAHAFAQPGIYPVSLQVTDNELGPETQTDIGVLDLEVLSVEDPFCGGVCSCQGKVSELTLRYQGSRPDARVRVFARRGRQRNALAFNGIVQPGGTFLVEAPPNAPNNGFAGTLGTEIKIFVDGHLNARIHTSCSQPVGPGLVSGDFLVVGGFSKRGGRLCPVQVDDCPDGSSDDSSSDGSDSDDSKSKGSKSRDGGSDDSDSSGSSRCGDSGSDDSSDSRSDGSGDSSSG